MAGCDCKDCCGGNGCNGKCGCNNCGVCTNPLLVHTCYALQYLHFTSVIVSNCMVVQVSEELLYSHSRITTNLCADVMDVGVGKLQGIKSPLQLAVIEHVAI